MTDTMFGATPSPPPTTPEEIDHFIMSNYPQLTWAMGDPELGPLLRRAAAERWDAGRLQGELQKTKWYRKRSADERQWDALIGSDPATAREQYRDAQRMVGQVSNSLGIAVPPNKLAKLTLDAASQGWDEREIASHLAAYLKFDPEVQLTGGAGAVVNQVKAQAANYFVPLSEEAAFEWGKKILTGYADEQALQGYLQSQAMSRFPTLAESIERGFSPKQLFDPYIQQIGQLLDVSPETIDLMDSKWSPVLDFVDSNGTRRPRTLSETSDFVRRQDEWRGTQVALDAGSQFVEEITKRFGKTA